MQICFPLQVGREKWNNYWVMRGKRKIQLENYVIKGKRNMERERSIEEGKPELVTVRVWGKKKKREEREWESVPWERDCFPKIFLGKQPIENKSYFY